MYTEVHHALIAPHCYCGPVVAAANIALATCTPNFLVLESIGTWGGFHAELLETPILWEDGMVIPSTEPGLGVVLNEEVARAHPYDGDELHLVPEPDPMPFEEALEPLIGKFSRWRLPELVPVHRTNYEIGALGHFLPLLPELLEHHCS